MTPPNSYCVSSQAYRTGQKQRLFYSAKLHPELATAPSPNPSSSTATAAAAADKQQQQLFFASLDKDKKEKEEAPTREKELVLSYCANVLGDWPAPADYTPRFLRVVLRRGEGGGDDEGKAAAGVGAGRQGDL